MVHLCGYKLFILGVAVIMYLNLEISGIQFSWRVLFSGVCYVKFSTDQLCSAFVDMVAF